MRKAYQSIQKKQKDTREEYSGGLDPFSWSQRAWKLRYSVAQTALDFDTPTMNAIGADCKTFPDTQKWLAEPESCSGYEQYEHIICDTNMI
jgi:hypothetical protein